VFGSAGVPPALSALVSLCKMPAGRRRYQTRATDHIWTKFELKLRTPKDFISVRDCAIKK
jgi:hypothetical protein